MRPRLLVLLDESLPKELARAVVGHEVRTVASMRWTSVENGELLRLASGSGFGALVTADRNREFQQNVAQSGLSVVVLIARSNRVEHVLPLAPEIVEALDTIQPGAVVHVGQRQRA